MTGSNKLKLHESSTHRYYLIRVLTRWIKRNVSHGVSSLESDPEKLFEANVVGSLKKKKQKKRRGKGEDKRGKIEVWLETSEQGELFRDSKWSKCVWMCVYDRGVCSNGNEEYRARVVRTLSGWKVGRDSGDWIVAWLSMGMVCK